jgi:Cytochrome P450
MPAASPGGAGASGFLGKSAEPAELLDAIRVEHRGDALLSPVATRSIIARYLDDLCDRFLGYRPQGHEQFVTEEVLIFLLAGHETTSTALTYTLHLLGRHSEVQDRVRDEVDAAGSGTTKLAYTEMVLKEAMRLYPPAPLMGRLTAGM